MVIRIEANQISRTRRVTQGVRLINLRKDQKVATIAVVPNEDAEVLETTTNEHTFEDDME